MEGKIPIAEVDYGGKLVRAVSCETTSLSLPSSEEARSKSPSGYFGPPGEGMLEFGTVHDVGLASSFEEEGKPEEKKVTQSCLVTNPEDLQFLIRNTDTGEYIDIRHENASMKLSVVDQKLTKLPEKEEKKPWEDWWAQKHKQNKALLIAVEKGQKEKILDLLNDKKHGDLISDVNAKGLDENTPMHIACSEGEQEIVEILIKNHANLENVTSSLRTPLHVACNRGYKSIIEALVAAHANINAQEIDGNTPTHILSSRGWVETLGWFLTKEPDLSIKNKYGETAVEVAGNVETRQVFSASVKVPEKEGDYSRTVLQNFVLRNSRADMVKTLMFKGGMIGAHHQDPTPPPALAKPSEKADPKAEPALKHQGQKSRKVKILEATKKLKDYNAEDSKAESAKGSGKAKILAPKQDGVEEEGVGPEDFEPLNILGKGSFGEVYLVKYKGTGKMYAMKVLNKRRVLSQNLVKYAKTERNVLCFTKHPFIVGLDFAFQTSEKLFMIMEFAAGGDLGHLLQREKRITEDRAKIYVSEVLLALEDLHKRDIIFRDLKPDNVVLDEEGHALLTDFGLSKEGVSDNMSAGSFCGSVAYLAPEMLRKSGHGKSVDWYLLGVLLYELLIGQPPYFTTNRDQLFKNIQSAPLRLPMFLSPEVKNLLISLLNRNPLKRLGSGKGDAEEIKKHIWFHNINWDDAINRKLKPPKPFIKPLTVLKISSEIFIDNSKDENHLKDWDHNSKPII